MPFREFIKLWIKRCHRYYSRAGFSCWRLLSVKVAPIFPRFCFNGVFKIPVTGIAILGAIVAVVMVNMPKFAVRNRPAQERLADEDDF